MNDTGALERATTLVLIIVLAVLGTGSVIAAAYVRNEYEHRTQDSPIYQRLVRRNERVAISGAGILAICILAIAGYALPRPWGAVAISVIVALMLIGPQLDAVYLARLKREAAAMGPDERQVREGAAIAAADDTRDPATRQYHRAVLGLLRQNRALLIVILVTLMVIAALALLILNRVAPENP